MRLASSDTADREAFDAALDATPLGSFRDAGESLVHRHSLLQARPPGSATRKESGHTRTAWPSGQIDPLLPSKLDPANGMGARERATA